MKSLIIAATILVLSIGQAFAFGGENVDSKIAKKFHSDFKNAQGVTWNVTDDFSVASYGINGTRMETYYNNEGELIGTFHNVSLDKMPVKALAGAQKKFKGYAITESLKADQPYGGEAYYVTMVGADKKVIIELNDKGWYKVLTTVY